MKLLFVCSEYCGSADAGARCIQRLRAELQGQGITSDVLTYGWAEGQPQQTEDEAGKIYTAKTWYRHARLVRNDAGQIKMSPLRWARVLCTRGYAMLTEGRHYAQRGMPVGATKELQAKLSGLCAHNQYDWVVSVSYPFANHLAVLKARLPGVKVALYNFDPYWNNQSYAPDKAERRAKEEAAAYKRADCIFCTPEQLPDYQGEPFAEVRDKIFPLHYPNFVPPRVERESAIRFDPNEISLLYLGTIYGGIRRPDTLFELFQEAVQKEPRLHLYVIGKKYGADADRYLVEYGQRLKGRLTVCAPVPPEETADLLRQADVLVNLGNTMRNQMPSKLLEYMASGKPILNICARTDCNTLPYLQRYPLALQCFSSGHAQAQQLAAFCCNAKGQSVPWETLARLYRELLVSSVCKGMLSKLQEASEREM